jgi:hypothetical protein
MLNIVIFVAALISVLNEVYLAHADQDEQQPRDEKKILNDIYARICSDIDISDFNIGNRPLSIKYGVDKEYREIVPESCIPIWKNKDGDPCALDMDLLNQKYREDGARVLKVYEKFDNARNYFNQLTFIKDTLLQLAISEEVRDTVGKKIHLRNEYFVGYIYSQLNNIGNCGQIVARTLYEFASKNKFGRMTIVNVERDHSSERSVLTRKGPTIPDHAFFVIDGSVAAGKYNAAALGGSVPDALLEGWICDPWRRDVRFGTVRDLVKSDPIYDWTTWDYFEVLDVQLPKLSTDTDTSWFEQIDFMSNPDFFINLFMAKSSLWKNALVGKHQKVSKKQMLKKIRAVLLLPEKDPLPIEHTEL